MTTAETTRATAASQAPCPACGGLNDADAVFCANPHCHKALGEFSYSEEEITARRSLLERVADRVNDFVGRPHFITIHVLWFAAWVLLNSGLIMGARVFDAYPYGLLGIVLAVEAVFITGFLLIAGQRQARRAEIRAEIEYEVNVRAYRKLGELERRFERLLENMERREAASREGP